MSCSFVSSTTLPLFPEPDYSNAQWDRILLLDVGTTAGRAFRHLLSFHMTAVDLARPEAAGLDYRRRIFELRKLGIPVLSEPVEGKPYNRYRLPPDFVAEYWRQRRAA